MFSFDFQAAKSGAPIVTLSRLGISFNSFSQRLLGNPEKISIGLDTNAMVIGIKEYDGVSSNSCFEFNSSSRTEKAWIRIGCKDFMRYVSSLSGMDFLEKAQPFYAEYDKEQKVLMVILDEKHKK